MKFIALDVETANADMASICQIGAAQYVDGEVPEEWSTLIDPEDYFDPMNVSIHGIRKRDVSGCPTFADVRDDLASFLDQEVCVCHTHFDHVSIARALDKYGLDELDITWLDSARVARRTWPQFARRGYGLDNICEFLEYEFIHHDALEDAKAAGYVLIEACKVTGLDVDGWLKRVIRPIDPNKRPPSVKRTRQGNPEGAFFGEVLVFTGSLQIPRGEAADMAAKIGCEVGGSVTKKTTMLVVGDEDLGKFSGQTHSGKHRKALALIAEGASLRILGETDFTEMVAICQ